MARTEQGAVLTRQHRTAQLAIRASMLGDLTRLWGTVDPVDLSGTIDRWASAAAVLVRARNQESATLGRRYFGSFRLIEGMGRIELPGLVVAPPLDVAAGQLRGAGLSGIINARRRGFSPEAAARNGLVKASGSASTLTLGGGRDQILTSVRADEQARGWIRITSGSPCAFCAMIASRAETNLFSTEKTADFLPHDHCSCTPEPIYPDSEIPELNREFRRQWNETRDLNAFRRIREGRE